MYSSSHDRSSRDSARALTPIQSHTWPGAAGGAARRPPRPPGPLRVRHGQRARGPHVRPRLPPRPTLQVRAARAHRAAPAAAGDQGRDPRDDCCGGRARRGLRPLLAQRGPRRLFRLAARPEGPRRGRQRGGPRELLRGGAPRWRQGPGRGGRGGGHGRRPAQDEAARCARASQGQLPPAPACTHHALLPTPLDDAPQPTSRATTTC